MKVSKNQNVDRLFEAIANSSTEEDDFKVLNRAVNFPKMEPDSDLNEKPEEFVFEAGNSESFDQISGFDEPRRPYGRWQNEKQGRALRGKYHHHRYRWTEDGGELW